ncbi:MAG: hypothetical protein J5I92_10785 [Thiogranum sp.]|nr:hypothetical protein [Thiogranum sp.]
MTEIKTRNNKAPRRTTPIDKNFLNRLDQFSVKHGWQKRALEMLKAGWLDSSEFLNNGLESAIVKRVAHYDMLSALYPDKSRRKCTNEDYLNQLTHLVADHLLKCKSNSSGHTKQFVGDIFPSGQSVDQYKNRIITFNYDLIIDRPLLERGISKRKIYFDRIVSKKSDGTKRARTEKFLHPLILKLHGSLNWRCDREYFDQIINGSVNPDLRIPIWSNDSKCPGPNDDESPLIIPPVPNKPITKASIFRMLWTTALEYLHEAKKIVIVGYSCPATDVLAQSMFTQFRNMDVDEIVIVDTDSGAFSRYHDLIQGRVRKSVRWRYCAGFSEFIEDAIAHPAAGQR